MNENTPLEALTPQQKRELLRRLLANKAAAGAPREFPLSYHQLAMWFLHRMAPELASYNTALAVEASPPLDTAALGRALNALAERHTALRTVYPVTGDVTIQRVNDAAPVPVRVVDAAALSPGQIHQAVLEEYARPFDLGLSPLRVALFRAENRDVLLIVVHHIAFDAWSAGVVYRELRALYEDGNAILPPLDAGYHDFVRWQREMVDSHEGEAHWRFWSQQLTGPQPELELPMRKAMTGKRLFSGAAVPVVVDGVVYCRLKELIREHQTTVFSAVTAAYTALLHLASGQDSLIVGTPVSGRTRSEWELLVGDFINMLPLPVHFPPGLRASDHLATVTLAIRQALEHQDFPFPLMIERLRVRRDAGRSPLFQAVVNVHVARGGSDLMRLFRQGERMPFGGSTLRSYAIPQQEGQFDLGLELLDTGDALLGRLHYSEDAFERYAAEYLTRQFTAVLRQMVEAPGRLIGEFAIEPWNGSEDCEHLVI